MHRKDIDTGVQQQQFVNLMQVQEDVITITP